MHPAGGVGRELLEGLLGKRVQRQGRQQREGGGVELRVLGAVGHFHGEELVHGGAGELELQVQHHGFVVRHHVAQVSHYHSFVYFQRHVRYRALQHRFQFFQHEVLYVLRDLYH